MIKKLIILLSIPISFYACIEIIDFETESKPQLMVYGKITNSTTAVPYIEIRSLGIGLTENMSIDHASVIVLENDVPVGFKYDSKNERYIPQQSGWKGVPNANYQLKLSIADLQIESPIEKMPNINLTEFQTSFIVERIETLSPNRVPIEKIVFSVFADACLPDTTAYFRWDIEEVYLYTQMELPSSRFPFYFAAQCFITSFHISNPLIMFSSANNSATNISNLLLLQREIDHTFEEIHYFGVVAHSLTASGYDYWQKVNELTSRTGSIFEVPPASIKGNLYCSDQPELMINGFFEIANVDTSSVYITRDDHPFYVPEICPRLPVEDWYKIPYRCYSCLTTILGISPECYNCSLVPNSSGIKPPYLPY